MKTFILAFFLCASPACLPAQDATPKATAPETPAQERRWEWREVAVADLRSLQFDTRVGSLTFSVGETRYAYSPEFNEAARSSPAANVSACAAVLAELRRAAKVKMQFAVSDKTYHSLLTLILLYPDAK